MLWFSILLSTTILFTVKWHDKTGTVKTSLVLTYVSLFLTTKVFSWRFVQHTPIQILQFPWSLLGIATLLVSIILTIFLSKQSKPVNNYFLWGVPLILLVLNFSFI